MISSASRFLISKPAAIDINDIVFESNKYPSKKDNTTKPSLSFLTASKIAGTKYTSIINTVLNTSTKSAKKVEPIIFIKLII